MAPNDKDDGEANSSRLTSEQDAAGKQGILNAQQVLEYLHYDIATLWHQIRQLTPDIDVKLIRTMNRFRGGLVIGDAGENGAFKLDHNRQVIIIDWKAIVMLIHMVDRLPSIQDSMEKKAILTRVIEVYVVHEILHIGQGLVRYRDVQKLKTVAPLDLLGLYDLIADHDAARFVAALSLARSGGSSRERFLNELLTTHFMVNAIALRTFKAPADKPQKRHRFLGIALHAALLHEVLSNNRWREFEERRFSLETAIYPYCSLETGQIVLTQPADCPRLLGIFAHVPIDFLQGTLNGLDSDPFEVTIQRAKQLLYLVGILPVDDDPSNEQVA